MKLGDTIFNGNQFKNVILNSTSYKRLILGVNLVWSYFGIGINAFKTRILADGGTYEGESILEDRLQEITPNLFDSASLVITPNGVKTSKLYVIKPTDGSSDLLVTRATTATRVNESGVIVNVPANVARIDYSTGQPAILVEPQRTNLLLQSDSFANSSWTGNSIVTSNTNIAPDGSLTADTLSDTSTTSYHTKNQTITVTANSTVTTSIFIKKTTGVINSYPCISLVFFGVSTKVARLIVDTTLGSFNVSPDNNLSVIGKIASYNGYWRVEMTTTDSGNNTSCQFTIYPSISTNGSTITMSAVGNIVCWGAQLELGSNATSYIPTTTTAVTRNADVISNTDTSTLIEQTEGTIFIDYNKVLSNDVARNIISLSDGTTSNLIEIWDGVSVSTFGRIVYIYITNNLLKISATGQPTISPSGRYKICLTYLITPSLVNFKFFINGVKLSDRNVTYDAFSSPLIRINISNRNGTSVGQGSHNLDFILKTRITDEQAIQLTTL